MSLKIHWIGNFNPFDFIKCPLCGCRKFTSLSCSSVWCDKCNTNFNVRYSAGDPGCVIDACMKYSNGPKHYCNECNISIPSLDTSPLCPKCGRKMARDHVYSMSFPREMQKQWYHILKVGDYSSGWLLQTNSYDTYREYLHPDGCRQRDWDKFQENHLYEPEMSEIRTNKF
jgi:hypothetical protein